MPGFHWPSDLVVHLARAAFCAISRRLSGVSAAARAFPPFRPPSFPSATAARFFTGGAGSVRAMMLWTVACTI